MKSAIHHDAFESLLDASQPYHKCAAILGGTVSTTAGILGKYQANLGANPHFQTWFASAQQYRKLIIHFPINSPRLVQAANGATDEYATASYFAGGTLIAKKTSTSLAFENTLTSIGTSVEYLEDTSLNTSNGDDPFFTIKLKRLGTIDFDILERFIVPEDHIIIYDKYINPTSIELINYIASKLSTGATISVFHSGQTRPNLLTTSAIIQSIKNTNPSINISCKVCDQSFTRDYHDRFIFFGNRFQLRMTAGLDSFGKVDPNSGRRKNRESELIFRDTSISGKLDILANDGSILSVNFCGA